MKITEVRIKLMGDSDDRLLAFCSITFDDSFVVRDLKIIDGAHGPFVAMPSRKLTSHCPNCGGKNHLRAAYCNHCGSRIKEEFTARDSSGRVVLYADIAHPINSGCREMIQRRVIADYNLEIERAAKPDYVSKYDDDYDWGEYDEADARYQHDSVRQENEAPENRSHDQLANPDSLAAGSKETPDAPAPAVPPPHTSPAHFSRPHESASPGSNVPGSNVPATKHRDEFGRGIF